MKVSGFGLFLMGVGLRGFFGFPKGPKDPIIRYSVLG